MLTFTTIAGKELKVRFKHFGKRKGHSPRGTTCRIYDGDAVLSTGTTNLVDQIPVVTTPEKVKDLFLKHGRRVKRVLRTVDGIAVALIQADNFSYKRGRKYALRQALSQSGLDKDSRRSAWDAFNGEAFTDSEPEADE